MLRAVAGRWSWWMVLGSAAALSMDQEEPAGEPARGELHFVTGAARLYPVPVEHGGPALGELLRGAAVLVHQTQGEFARVTVQAWVAADRLATERPEPETERASASEGGRPAEKPATGEVLSDLSKVHHVGVEVDRIQTDEGDALVVSLRLLTRHGALVDPQEQKLKTLVSVFEERRIAGGRVRGAVLGRHDHWHEGRISEKQVSLAELDLTESSRLGRVSVQVELPSERHVYGTAAEIPLGDR